MHRYYSAAPGKGIDPSQTNLSDAALEEFYVGGIRNRLRAAVDRRMMSDVPFGVFLSEDIDLSTNVALMSEYSNQPINTFTVGFKDPIRRVSTADVTLPGLTPTITIALILSGSSRLVARPINSRLTRRAAALPSMPRFAS